MADLKRKIGSALAYPTLLAIAGMCVVGFLLFYVVPRFGVLFEDFGDRLSWIAQLIVLWTRFVNGGTTLAIAGIVAFLIVITALTVKRYTKRDFLYSPFRSARLDALIFKYHVANIARTLSMLCLGGIPLSRALHIVSETVTNPGLQKKLRSVIQSVSEGQSLSSAFTNESLGDEVTLRLLAVGERSGDLSAALARIALFHDGQLTAWIDRFMRLFEPALMLALGLIVGSIVVLMYLPIFELAGSLQ